MPARDGGARLGGDRDVAAAVVVGPDAVGVGCRRDRGKVAPIADN